MNTENDYLKLYDSFGSAKAGLLMKAKFQPTYRIGLTNYLREKWIFRLLDIAEQDVVADIGCASGRQVFIAAERARQVIGTDIAKSFIDYANQHKQEIGSDNTRFVVCPIESMPLETHSIDKLICSEVMEHILEPDVAMRELYRVIKPDGKLLITVPNLNADGTLWGRLMRFLKLRKFTPLTEFNMEAVVDHGDAHVREFTAESLREFVRSYGFEPITGTTVSMVDFHDRAISLVLRASPIRKAVISLEMWLSRRRLPFGRHLVLVCRKRLTSEVNQHNITT